MIDIFGLFVAIHFNVTASETWEYSQVKQTFNDAMFPQCFVVLGIGYIVAGSDPPTYATNSLGYRYISKVSGVIL